jgi:hypothetical protein
VNANELYTFFESQYKHSAVIYNPAGILYLHYGEKIPIDRVVMPNEHPTSNIRFSLTLDGKLYSFSIARGLHDVNFITLAEERKRKISLI